jgi:SAM-dependent methyltransferase
MGMDNIQLWENIFKSKEWGKYPPEPIIRFIAKNFYKEEERKEIKILELGSGTGSNLWFCAREGFSVYGIDGSSTAVSKMLERFKDDNLTDMLIGSSVGDYYDQLHKLKDNYFDAIIDVESLCCNSFEKSKEIVDTAFNKLKTGGVFFSMTFANGTFGVSGKEVDYHAVMPIDGPMTNKGFTRYTTRGDIGRLYENSESLIESIERQDLILDSGDSIKEWIIECRKI